MPNRQALAAIVDLLDLAHPGATPILVDWHSDGACTMVAVAPGDHYYRMRWNLGDSGHWTMIPICQDVLTPGA